MSLGAHDEQADDGFDFDIDDVTASEPNYPIVFEQLRSTTPKCVGLILFSVASIGFGLVMFLLHLFVIPGNNQVAMHASSTLPILMGVFAGTAAWSLLSTPGQVRICAHGIEVGKTPARTIPWEQIDGVFVDSHNSGWGGPAKSLRLMDSQGKLIIRIGGALEHFDRLIELVRESTRSAAPEMKSAEDVGPDRTALREGRKRAILTGLGAVLFSCATTFVVYDGWWNHQAEQRMANEGVDGTGTVIRHFVAPNGITRRIEYEVKSDDGASATHNVEIEQELHERLNVGDTVQIRYVPGDPRISRLLSGEIHDDDEFIKSTPGIVLLGCGGLVMAIFMGVMTVISWKGYDIKVDGARMRMVPLGK